MKRFLILFSLYLLLLALPISPASAQMQVVNHRLELKEWEFRRAEDSVWQTVTLPHSCNSEDGQSEHYYRGLTEYRTRILLRKGHHYSVIFYGAAQRAVVSLNNHELTNHYGGYTPFTVELPVPSSTQYALLKVVCDNQMDLTLPPVSSDFNKNNGLHDRVELCENGEVAIDTRTTGYDGILVSTVHLDAEYAAIQVRTSLRNYAKGATNLVLATRVLDANNRPVAYHSRPLKLPGESVNDIVDTLKWKSPHLWQGTADPYLYTVEMRLMQKNIVLEQCSARIGLRTLEADPEQGLLLNGQPILLRGMSYHRDLTHRASAMTNDEVDRDFEIIRDLGINMLRVAHYPHSRHTFDRCDELGILVQTEIPWVNECGRDTSRYSQAEYRQHLLSAMEEMLRGHHNHPSIGFWGMWNELGGSHAGWPVGGLDTTFLVSMTDTLYALAHQLAPGRLCGFAEMGYANRLVGLQRGKNFDYFGVNKYFGWYQDMEVPEGGPLMGEYMDQMRALHGVCAITEYGAGNSPDQHSAHPEQTTIPSGGGLRHDEEWANRLHESHVKAIMARPWLVFTTGWVLFDFAVADRREGSTMYINDKGLVTRDRSLKKDVFYLYRAWLNPQPTVYITSRRWTEREEKEYTVRVYSNAASLSLYRNDKLVQTLTECPDESGIIWEFRSLPFATKEDTLRVVGTYPDGSTVSDTVTLRSMNSLNF